MSSMTNKGGRHEQNDDMSWLILFHGYDIQCPPKVLEQ